MTETRTKREYFNELKAIGEVQASAELTAFIEHELELLDRKNTNRSNKPTKTQKANLELQDIIYNELFTSGKEMTVTEMLTNLEVCKANAMTAQKLTAMLTPLVKNGRITREMKKKKAYYKAN